MTEPLVITAPGVYADIPNDVYHADPVKGGSLSTSGAKLLLEAPAIFDHNRKHPRPPSKAMNLGSAAHMEVLGEGPELVHIKAKGYQTNAAKEARDKALAEGKTPVLTHELETVMEMADALRKHPFAAQLFTGGKAEQSAFWPDPETGIWRRVRFDWLPTGVEDKRLIIPDYKTSHSADPKEFGKAAADYGYDMQADAYTTAAVELGLDDDPAFVFVVQCSKAPYLVSVVQLDAEAMEIGRARNRRALDIYGQCVESDQWPAYSNGVEQVSLPSWFVYNFRKAIA